MKDLLDRYLFAFPRNTPDAGAGGDGGNAGAGDGAGDPAAGAGDPNGGSGSGAGDPPPQAYFPEGLADNLKGASDRETIDNMAGALKGYRERDAGKDLPEKPEGYLSLEGVDEKSFQLDDKFKPHFESFANDPGMKAAAAVAQKHGIPRPAFLEALQASMASLSEAGLLEPMVDAEAERAALLPEAAKALAKDQQDAAIDKRMNDNFAFVELMVANRALPKDAAEYAQMMLGDSAKGHAFLEWMRSAVQGGGSGPGAHGDGGGAGDTRESLRDELAAMEKLKGSPSFDRAKYDALDERYRKLLG